MTEEDFKYRQGRSKKQTDSNEKIAAWSVIGLIACLILIKLFS